jgi:glycosyltransferase involved in cell wall biosynthesis
METKPTYVFLTWEDISYSRTGVIYFGLKRYGSKPVLHQISLGTIYNMSIQVRRFINSSDNENQIFVVGSPCGLLVLSVRIASPKARIIFDTGWPQIDALMLKRNKSAKYFFKYLKMYLLDFVSFKMSHIITVESNGQKSRLAKNFLVNREKLLVSYTGLNEEEFKGNQGYQNGLECGQVVIFRGKVNSEAGIELIAEVSWLLPKDLKLVVISQNIPREIVFSPNTQIISERVSNSRLADYYAQASMAIGQLGNSSRTEFTIPHKFFEASYFGVPYLTWRTEGLSELISFSDYELYLHKCDARGIATTISDFVRDKERQSSVANYLQESYKNSFSQKIISTSFEDYTSKYFSNLSVKKL